jgi:8-oxo-dGTP pyrophosphatase MutT (NUDIX family)
MNTPNVPTSWQAWLALVRQALLPGPTVTAEQLLLVRSLDGTPARPLNPPEGVTPRRGAVLVLLYPDGDDLRFPLTVRSERLPNHRGEVSLPGGAVESFDADDAAAALRECYEELGVETSLVSALGTLSPVYIRPSNFRIVPVVGTMATMPVFRPHSDEVSAVITTTLRELVDPALVVTEQWTLRGMEVLVPYYAIMGCKVWGATALVLSELVAHIRRASSALQEEEIQ